MLALEPRPISLAQAQLRQTPFRYSAIPRCLDQGIADELLDWFEHDAPWKLIETDFYEQYEFSLLDSDAAPARLLTNPKAMGAARDAMASLFQCAFKENLHLVAHKLVPGQRIAIHNDFLPGQETHRLTIQLNRGLEDADGGFFMLFNSDNAADIHEIHRPCHLSALAFEISEASFHAVSRMLDKERYTLVYSFFADRR